MKYLKAGGKNREKYGSAETGMPQGENGSSFLSGIMLNELDQEREKRIRLRPQSLFPHRRFSKKD